MGLMTKKDLFSWFLLTKNIILQRFYYHKEF